MKVAFIDDSATVRLMLTRALEAAGHQPLCCTSFAELEQALEEHDLDLLMSDVEMPEMSGDVIVTALRKSQPELKMIFHSSLPAAELRRLAKAAGADGYIRKTTDFEALVAAISAYLT